MRLLVLITTALLAALDRHPAAAARSCDTLSLECRNGLFNRDTCECDCIKPFCRDAAGECSQPTSSCGGNPWARCEKGRNCPWWPSTLTAESCTTGPNVPAGVWTVHESRSTCCRRNFPDSEWCVPENEVDVEMARPTRYPTIAVEEDEIEVVPLRFDLVNVPEAGLSLPGLKAEMTTILKRVLVRLSERVDGMRITRVEERVRSSRGLREVGQTSRRRLQVGEGGLRPVTMFFDVHVVRVDGMRFGPIIVGELRDSYYEIAEEIRSYSDVNLLGSDLALNLCSSQSGQFTNCISDEPRPVYEKDDSSNDAGRVSKPAALAEEPTDEGLAGWAVAVIVLVVLALLSCVGGLALYTYHRRDEDGKQKQPLEKHVHNGLYYPQESVLRKPRRVTTHSTNQDSARSRGDAPGRSRPARGRGRVPSRQIRREPRTYRGQDRMYEPTATPDTSDNTDAESAVDLILSETSREDPSFDDEVFSFNTYATRSNKRVGRDPTMYIPGQEDRPDPEAVGGGQLVVIADGGDSRRYHEDPPLRVKRDPSSYETTSARDEGAASHHLRPLRREPTAYYDEGGMDASEPHSIYPISEDGSHRHTHKIDDSARSNRSNRSYRENNDQPERSGYSSLYELPEMSTYNLSFATEAPSHDMSEGNLTDESEEVDESFHESFQTEEPKSTARSVKKKKRRSQPRQKSFPV